MPPSVIVGAIAGAVVGWIIAAVFSKGPKTPMQALSGDFEGGGTGCVGFLIFVGLGAVGGGIAGAVIGGG